MPVHDWTRVSPGLFHDFHQSWTFALSGALNAELLPDGFFAVLEWKADPPISKANARNWQPEAPPHFFDPPESEPDDVCYARKANRITIRCGLEIVVAVIELVSPGDKSSRAAVQSFARSAAGFLRADVHLLLIDLFPATPHDPQGIHAEIMGQMDCPSEPEDKPLTLASYDMTGSVCSSVESFAVGDLLHEMPLALWAAHFVRVPLEATYQATWTLTPKPIRDLLDPPAA